MNIAAIRLRTVLGALLAASLTQACSVPRGPAPQAEPAEGAERVRLVLQITIDQLRADLAVRNREQWTSGGFRRLYDNGAVFTEAHHAHANTETIVGHVTLATGT
ncbi:MAG: alkaline phosphatase family protein, partial [Candidatus Binatia bacterium]